MRVDCMHYYRTISNIFKRKEQYLKWCIRMFYFGLRSIVYAHVFGHVIQYGSHLPHVATEHWTCALSKMRCAAECTTHTEFEDFG